MISNDVEPYNQYLTDFPIYFLFIFLPQNEYKFRVEILDKISYQYKISNLSLYSKVKLKHNLPLVMHHIVQCSQCTNKEIDFRDKYVYVAVAL